MAGANFDINKTIKKFFTGLGISIIPFILAYSIEFLETEEFPPEYAGYIVISIAILHSLTNFIKHKFIVDN